MEKKPVLSSKKRKRKERSESTKRKRHKSKETKTRVKEAEKLDLLEADRATMTLSDLITKTKGGSLTKAQQKREEEKARKKAEQEKKRKKVDKQAPSAETEDRTEVREMPYDDFQDWDEFEPVRQEQTLENDVGLEDLGIDWGMQGSSFAAPKVRVTASGDIVLDQNSVRVVEQETQRTLVRDDGSTGVGYGKAARPDKWSKEETDRFYELIRQIGTDFNIMQFFFPDRTRGQIKTKFKREERVNERRITRALKNPLPFDLKKFAEVSGITLEDLEVAEEDAKKNLEQKGNFTEPAGEFYDDDLETGGFYDSPDEKPTEEPEVTVVPDDAPPVFTPQQAMAYEDGGQEEEDDEYDFTL